MSRVKLKETLDKVLKNLETYGTKEGAGVLRRKKSGVHTHQLDFHPDKIFKSTMEELEGNKTTGRLKNGKMGKVSDPIRITPQQEARIKAASYAVANRMKRQWGTRDYIYEQSAEDGKNIYRKLIETTPGVYPSAMKQYNRIVGTIINGDRERTYSDAGHVTGSGISETSLLFAFEPGDLKATLDIVRQTNAHTVIHTLLEKIPGVYLKQAATAFEFTIMLEPEAKTANKSTETKETFYRGLTEAKFRQATVDEIKKILSMTDWGFVEGSLSLSQEAAEMVSAAIEGRKPKKVARSKASQTIKIKRKITTYRDKTPVSGLKPKQQNLGQWLSLIQTINSRLPEVVRGNMGSPGLVNRTGAFANSTRATTVQTTPQGFPSIGYTYDKTPYGVFDRRLGALPWATPERDPGLVIEKSIREIVSSLAIGRFYLRRE